MRGRCGDVLTGGRCGARSGVGADVVGRGAGLALQMLVEMSDGVIETIDGRGVHRGDCTGRVVAGCSSCLVSQLGQVETLCSLTATTTAQTLGHDANK